MSHIVVESLLYGLVISGVATTLLTAPKKIGYKFVPAMVGINTICLMVFSAKYFVSIQIYGDLVPPGWEGIHDRVGFSLGAFIITLGLLRFYMYMYDSRLQKAMYK